VVTTLAGTAGQMGSADGTGAAASFYHPYGVAVDGSGNVYVADTDNNTIRKVTPAGVVTTLVGNPLLFGTAAGPLPSSLETPLDLAVDPTTGNLFIVLPDAVVEVWL
jgi:DNA-binding beta-propeller fold protein YncE